MNNSVSTLISPSSEMISGGTVAIGGAVTSALAAKSVIVIGSIVYGVPIIGVITGLALMILGMLMLYHGHLRRSQVDLQNESNLNLNDSLCQYHQNLENWQQGKLSKIVEQDTSLGQHLSDQMQDPKTLISNLPNAAFEPIDKEKGVVDKDKALITPGDQVLAASNAIQWGLLAAAGYGVAPGITAPLSILSGLASEIATFKMLPKDASLFRQALSFPILSKALINYNPMISRIWQAFSLYNLALNSGSKLMEAWEMMNQDPIKALKAGALHLFNLSSGVAFSAESLGLIDLKAKSDKPPCNPPEPGCQGPVKIQEEPRSIKLATIYNNNGNLEREKISELVTKNHREIAEKWGLDHEVITTDLVAGKCLDSNGNKADCSPYMNKIEYFRRQCADPNQKGKWIIYGDDDLIYTNPNINPWKAIDLLRNGKDTSVIMMQEAGDWVESFPLPGYKSHDPRVSVNTGFIMARIDDASCDLMERTWNHRNTKMDPSYNSDKCPTVAYCKNHGVTSLGDQTAMGLALQDDLSVIDRSVTIVLPRDQSAPHRAHIAFNTLHRDGCHQVLEDGKLTDPYDISEFDRRAYPDGMWKPGDWNGQPAGFKVMGKYPLPKDSQGRCIRDESQPIRNIRLIKINELINQTQKEQKFTLGTTFSSDGNAPESEYQHLTVPNHQKFAELNRAEFRLDTDPIQLKCQVPNTNEERNCVPYWRKVDMIDRWLKEPPIPGKEEFFVYGDEDGIYANMNLDLSKMVQDLRKGTDASIIIAKDLGEKYSPVNTGWMIFRKDEASRRFMDEWLKERNVPPTYGQPGDPDCPTLGLCVNQKTSLHEQEAFTNVLNRNPALKDSVVKIVDIRDPKLGYGVNAYVRHGCFSRYEPSKNWIRENFNYDEDYVMDKTGRGKRGDGFVQTAGVPRVGTYCDEPKGTPPHPIRKTYIQNMLDEMVEPSSYKPSYKKWGSELIKDPMKDQGGLDPIPVSRKITIGAAYNNEGNKNRDDISNYSNQNHKEYADKWKLQHEVINGNLVKNQCTDPRTNKEADCVSYWNKIGMIRNWLNEPKDDKVDEEWRLYLDDDMLVMNQSIDPYKVIDQLRGGKDTSVIIAKDVIDWQRWFFGNTVPNMAVNTGAFIVRKDQKSREFFDHLWTYRNTLVKEPIDVCPTIGMCQSQDKSLHEQQAWTMLLRENPKILDDVVTVIAPRDKASKTRNNIAMNTFYRKGCFQRFEKNRHENLFSYEDMDRTENPDGAFQKGDWLTQVAGVPVWGKEFPLTNGNCVYRNDVEPTTVRLNKIKELGSQVVK